MAIGAAAIVLASLVAGVVGYIALPVFDPRSASPETEVRAPGTDPPSIESGAGDAPTVGAVAFAADRASSTSATDAGNPVRSQLDPQPAAPEMTTVGDPTPVPAPEPEAQPARLTVGVIPMGRVWIDGRAHGSGPVTVRLPAGRHTVAGGRRSPEVTEVVRLRGGERREIVLRLR